MALFQMSYSSNPMFLACVPIPRKSEIVMKTCYCLRVSNAQYANHRTILFEQSVFCFVPDSRSWPKWTQCLISVLTSAQNLSMLYSDGIHSENSCTCLVALPYMRLVSLVYCPVFVWMSLFLVVQALVMCCRGVPFDSFWSSPKWYMSALTDKAGCTPICERK